MIHRPGIQADGTIVAIASGRGLGSRGIVRISGPDSLTVAGLAFGHCLEASRRGELYSTEFGMSVESSDDLAAEFPVSGNLLVWPDSCSYTGQPAVEFHTSVPQPVLEKLVARCCRFGARLAMPGEFTMRAFVAGRLDLTQAEAVVGLIHAQNDREFSTALSQLAGGLAIPFSEIRETLLTLLADLEAGLDFVEDDIEFVDREQLVSSIESALEKLRRLWMQMAWRGAADSGFKVVLAGLPNSGKSSLFNALTGEDSAIVSDIEGTTRDYLTRRIQLGPLAVDLIDTAGGELPDLNPPNARPNHPESIDETGIGATNRMAGEKTRGALAQADLVVFCIDTSRPDPIREFARARECGLDLLVVTTKSDLAGTAESDEAVIATSSRTGAGLDELRLAIIEKPGGSSQNACEVVPATLLRCGDALERAISELNETLVAMQSGFGDEIVAAGLRTALEHIGSISGDVCTDDILDRIFSRFCIGK